MRIILRNALITLVLATYATVAYPAEWKIDPTLRFRAGYNDNLRMSIDDKISSAEATFSPSAVFSVATPTSGLSGNVRFDFRRFEDDSNLDDDNTRFELNSFKNLERSRLGLDLGLIKDTTLDTQLEATGLAFDRIRRELTTVNPNWTFMFSERTQLSTSYSYTNVEYKSPGNSGFVNYTLNSANTSLSRVMNEKTIASITLSGTQSENDNNVKSTNINLQAGASYQFSETLSASLFAGIRSTGTDISQTSLIPIFSGNTRIGFVPLTRDISNSSSGSTFNASITKTFLRGETGASASRDISNDINGIPIEVTRLRLTNLYRLSSILSTSLKLEFYKSNTNSNLSSSLNREYYLIEPTFTWTLKEFWSLSGSYRYRRQTFNDASDDATQNAAYLTLAYRWPRIAVSR